MTNIFELAIIGTSYKNSKELLFAHFVENLYNYHLIVLENAKEGEQSILMAYLMELASMLSICKENPVAYDIYVGAYTYPASLQIIREYDI